MLEGGFFEWLPCFAEAVAAQDESDYTKYDLKAQQDMAEWTYGMFVLSFATTVLTGIGLFFIYRSLAFARDANEAAFRAVESSERLTKSQGRCYLNLRDPDMVMHSGGDLCNESEIRYSITLRNVGQSDAKNFSITASDFEIELRPSGRKFAIDATGVEYFVASLSPNDDAVMPILLRFPDEFIDDTGIKPQEPVESGLVFDITAKYADIFGDNWSYHLNISTSGRIHLTKPHPKNGEVSCHVNIHGITQTPTSRGLQRVEGQETHS